MIDVRTMKTSELLESYLGISKELDDRPDTTSPAYGALGRRWREIAAEIDRRIPIPPVDASAPVDSGRHALCPMESDNHPDVSRRCCRAVCECGWKGPWQLTTGSAIGDHNAHREASK